jgi:hypothetical protein
MFSRKAEAPFAVHVPEPAEDRPSWTRVGVIATIGFLIGVAWPKMAGVRLGPSVPDAPSATAASVAPGGSAAAEPSAPTPATTTSSVPVAAATPLASAPPPSPLSLSVSHGTIFACKTGDGDALKAGDCGTVPGLDNVVMPRLRKLADCAEAAQATGKVHFVVKADFARNTLTVDLGRNPSVPQADPILACAKADFAGAAPGGLPHENPRYSLAYSVTFGSSPAAEPSATASPSAVHVASDATQVVWEVAIVRDEPKTGKVVARLQRGTPLQIGPVKDGWYPVKFGDGFASDGWVYRGAIGR